MLLVLLTDFRDLILASFDKILDMGPCKTGAYCCIIALYNIVQLFNYNYILLVLNRRRKPGNCLVYDKSSRERHR